MREVFGGFRQFRQDCLFGRPRLGSSNRLTNPILASLVSLVAGVFRSPNFIPTQVMVRSEQWWRRLFADLSSQGEWCGSVIRWRGFACRRSTGGRSSLSKGDAPGYVEGGLGPKKDAVCQWASKSRHRWARQNQPLEAKAQLSCTF